MIIIIITDADFLFFKKNMVSLNYVLIVMNLNNHKWIE